MAEEQYFQMQGRVPTGKRLEFLERDSRDHARSLTELIGSMGDFGKRLNMLEQAHQQFEIYRAREEERDIALQDRLKKIDIGIADIKGTGSKLLWIVATAVVGTFVAFILKGGLFS